MKALLRKLASKIKYAFECLINVEWTSWMLGRLPFSLQGRKWEMHITDADTFPSVPHLHAVEDPRFKIDVYTGEVYWDRKRAGKLKEKELSYLWKNDDFLRMLEKSRGYYETQYPDRELPDYPYFIKMEELDDMQLHTIIENVSLVVTTSIREKRKK